MDKARNVNIDAQQAQAFLSDHFSADIRKVALIGEGAWSRCFGFCFDQLDLVVRFGNHLDDFQKDQLVYAYATPALPIPKVLKIGNAFEGYFAISTRVHGVPLESLNAQQWRAVVPSLAAAMEAMRTADVSDSSGLGGWGLNRNADHESWSSYLLAVDEDSPSHRTYGWRAKLAASPHGDTDFDWGHALLKSVVSDSVPRNLVHCDLINRNVLVQHGEISGVFDWGCSLYGDHLYELAWFEFWSPWYPDMDVGCLKSELERRWVEVGYAPTDAASRLMACYLHIGLAHLAYNAFQEDWVNLSATAERMKALVVQA